ILNGWDKLYSIATWVFNVVYLNLLWILFSIIGLVFFGLFPATAAMFAIVRKWIILGERDFNIFTIFWSFYRKDFLKLNGFALFFFIIGYFIYFIISFFLLFPYSIHLLYQVMIILTLVYGMTLLYFFPVYVHFKLGFFQYIRQAFLLAVISPLEVIGVIVVAAILFAFIVWIPGIIPLFSGSALS